jgi:hypothetical protein
MNSFVENNKIIGASAPANMTGTAMTAKYVSLKNYEHLTIIIKSGAWAGGTAAVTLAEATNVSAGSAQALGFDYQWTGTVASGALTKTAVTSDTFNISAANTFHVIEVDASELSAGFDCITVAIASPGAKDDYYSVDYILSQPRYAQATPPTAIAD